MHSTAYTVCLTVAAVFLVAGYFIFAWRAIVLPAYGPTLASGAAAGAVLPVAALRAHQDLGADLATAGLVVALIGIGQLVGALPAGALVARLGERRALTLGAAVDVGAIALAGFACIVINYTVVNFYFIGQHSYAQ